MIFAFLKKYKEIIPIFFLRSFQHEVVGILKNKDLIFSLFVLKTHTNYQFSILSCVSGVDFFKEKYRFCSVYDFVSIHFETRIRIKVFASEVNKIFSVITIFSNANWWEREIWDLFGIFFVNHNDLRRILTDYGFEGHALRKDFPLSGYNELCYNQCKGRIVSIPLQLTQEYRYFSHDISW
jgi:NADH dehydrogenase (ubiquinone) Fe-S protein 3